MRKKMLTEEQFENLKKQAQEFFQDCSELNQIMDMEETHNKI